MAGVLAGVLAATGIGVLLTLPILLAMAVVGLVPLLGALVTGAVAAFGIGGLLLRFTRGPPGDRSPDASDPF